VPKEVKNRRRFSSVVSCDRFPAKMVVELGSLSRGLGESLGLRDLDLDLEERL